MSIFKSSSGDAAQTATATPPAGVQTVAPEQSQRTPPFVPRGPPGTPARAMAAAGVVPPAAAPTVSARPVESPARQNVEAKSANTESGNMVKEVDQAALESAQLRMRAAALRAARSATVMAAAAPVVKPRQTYDPVAATQAGLLNLAWKWQEAGAPIRAIHAYMQVLVRYPDTPGAEAAVADLMELSDKLATQGQFHTALAIYEHLEHLLT